VSEVVRRLPRSVGGENEAPPPAQTPGPLGTCSRAPRPAHQDPTTARPWYLPVRDACLHEEPSMLHNASYAAQCCELGAGKSLEGVKGLT
jgi:hypothetical protein